MNTVYLVCSVIGGALLVLRVVLMLAGMDHHGDLAGHFGDHGDNSGNSGFSALSLHGLAAFFLMFGLVGLAARSPLGLSLSIMAALGAGFAAIWLMGRLFSAFAGLQSSGNIETADTVGCPGEVYLTIPPGGLGRVTVAVSGRTREYDAGSDSAEALKTGTPVRVVRVTGSVLVVEPAER